MPRRGRTDEDAVAPCTCHILGCECVGSRPVKLDCYCVKALVGNVCRKLKAILDRGYGNYDLIGRCNNAIFERAGQYNLPGCGFDNNAHWIVARAASAMLRLTTRVSTIQIGPVDKSLVVLPSCRYVPEPIPPPERYRLCVACKLGYLPIAETAVRNSRTKRLPSPMRAVKTFSNSW